MMTMDDREPRNRGLAAQRAAETLLQTLGGTSISIRLPLDTALTELSQLGLASVATEEIVLAPVVTRNLTAGKDPHARLEILVSAACLARTREIYSISDAMQLFDSALGVIQRGKLFRIESVDVDEFSGFPYLYRLTVSE